MLCDNFTFLLFLELSVVEIACLEPQGHANLDSVIGELVDARDSGASIGRVRLVQNVPAKWRQFRAGVGQQGKEVLQPLMISVK